MGSLTENTPKPMLEVAGKTLLEHKLDALPSEIDEVIFIVGYLGGKIQEHFGGEHNGTRLLYVEQENPAGGTADALWQAKDILHDRFLVLNGDDLYGRGDLAALTASSEDWAFLVEQTDDTSAKGKIVLNEEGHVVAIREGGTHNGGVGFANTGACVLDTRIFEHQQVPKAPGSSETGLPQTALAAAPAIPVSIRTVVARAWFPITAPEDLVKAEAFLKR